MRVRGLKPLLILMQLLKILSHPMRVRGLKLHCSNYIFYISMSHPMRVRGLKRVTACPLRLSRQVAPHAGAWIET